MTEVRDAGFVLLTWPLREADLIVSLLTQGHGKIRGVAHGARRPKSRWAGALDALTEVEVHWRARGDEELHSLREGSILRSPYLPMPGLPQIWTFAYVSELVHETAPAHDADPALYRLVRAAVDAVRAGQEVGVVARYVEAWVLRLHGILPDVAACAACGQSLGKGGGAWMSSLHGLACPRCEAGVREAPGPVLLAADAAFLEALRRRPPGEVASPSAPSLRRTRAFLRRLLHEAMGKPLRSASLLDSLDGERKG